MPAKTIRYYEDIDLLPPPARTAAGYRDYDTSAVARLRFIRAAQSVDLSLGEVREVLAFRDRGDTPCGHVTALIEARAADLSERIAVLERMRRDLTRLAKRARTLPAQQPGAPGFCHIIETIRPRSNSPSGKRRIVRTRRAQGSRDAR